MARKHNHSGQLRIIGGEWRGRKLDFPAVEGLRPTADRVRETLFNWLQMDVPGARCLDLFAGSGALGLEALSRGAREVVMVEQNPQAARHIREHLKRLNAQRGVLVESDAWRYLSGPAHAFDIVFIDPPYALDALSRCCQQLEQGGWLTDNAIIYLEDSSQRPAPELPPNWSLSRQKKAGEIAYYLARRLNGQE